MEIDEYLQIKKEIHRKLIDFLDLSDNVEENFQNFIQLFKKHKFHEDRYEFAEFIRLLSQISSFHFRRPKFIEKVENILIFFKPEIQKYLTNNEIFEIFKLNKRILLFLIENQMVTVDYSIASGIYRGGFYVNYFFNEIKPFISEEEFLEIERLNANCLDNFEENRKIGENTDYICKLIRDDNIEEFIIYVKKNGFPLNSNISRCIFETNNFLIFENYYYQKTTLIEYSAFFGSNQIFKYLFLNGVKLTDSIWEYAVHGEDEEIIHILEENGIEPPMHIHHSCLDKSIRSHQINATEYLLRKLKDEYKEDYYMEKIKELNQYPEFNVIDCLSSINSIKYLNYLNFPDKLDGPFVFNYLCKYNYVNFVKILLKTKNIKINQRVINNYFFVNGMVEPVFKYYNIIFEVYIFLFLI